VRLPVPPLQRIADYKIYYISKWPKCQYLFKKFFLKLSQTFSLSSLHTHLMPYPNHPALKQDLILGFPMGISDSTFNNLKLALGEAP
jgi:hypothetical protein